MEDVKSRLQRPVYLVVLTLVAAVVCVWLQVSVRELPGLKFRNIKTQTERHQVSMTGAITLDSFPPGASAGHVNMTEVFAARRHFLLEHCKTKAVSWRGDGSVKRLVISKRYKIAYCPVPKIASTFWSNLLLENKPMVEPTDHHDRLTDLEGNKSTLHLRNLNFDLGYWFLKHYRSILIVREPYSRLLAAYIDKFFTPNPLYWKLGQHIIKTFRDNPDPVSARCGQDVTFAEFIKHVIADIKQGNPDQHWKPIYQRCSPCQLEYDIITKLETINAEGEYVIKQYLPQTTFTDMVSQTALVRLNMNIDNFFRFFPPSVRYCMPFPQALHRLLRKLQTRGTISKEIELPRAWKLQFGVTHREVKAFMHESFKRSATDTSAQQNRQEALIEAFSTVSTEDLEQIRDLYQPDFRLFGYDPEPDFLFKRQKENVKRFFFT